MDVRPQVFVSSTYLDLVEERQAVTRILLELNCFPAGMELFPAGDDDKMDLIKGVIDDSDYYILILGGKYGSVDAETDVSYTEMEYDYAIETQTPVMAFLKRDLDSVVKQKTELDPKKAEQLEEFRKKAESKRTVRYFDGKDDLAAQIATSLVALQKKKPAIGWVRGDFAMTPEMRGELAELRAKVTESTTSEVSPLFPDLEDGEDGFEYDVSVVYVDRNSREYSSGYTVITNWNEIFKGIAPKMLHEASDRNLDNALTEHLNAMAFETFPQINPDVQVQRLRRATVRTPGILDDVIVQFLALRLVERGTQKRGVNDRQRYWKLTANGEDRMMQLRARRKTSEKEVAAKA
ncbi:DUF4062 domain-containing protein [Arthrobacter sp. 18067]|uniref:DUF4062 domain-containing protein n=1 Tax=Arthrobacter sp. 18067 TaxID=2681413 RepID=UPI00135B49D9|nr:DUF4062 domain-containing protein [Arthrobacter sp. 18067]